MSRLFRKTPKKPVITPKENLYNSIEEELLADFGEGDLYSGGYITTDGKFIDLRRNSDNQLDHSVAARGTDTKWEAIMNGLIRYDINGSVPSMSIGKKPTIAQEERIEEFLNAVGNQEIAVDLVKRGGMMDDEVRDPLELMERIRRFYAVGQTHKSNYMSFNSRADVFAESRFDRVFKATANRLLSEEYTREQIETATQQILTDGEGNPKAQVIAKRLKLSIADVIWNTLEDKFYYEKEYMVWLLSQILVDKKGMLEAIETMDFDESVTRGIYNGLEITVYTWNKPLSSTVTLGHGPHIDIDYAGLINLSFGAQQTAGNIGNYSIPIPIHAGNAYERNEVYKNQAKHILRKYGLHEDLLTRQIETCR